MTDRYEEDEDTSSSSRARVSSARNGPSSRTFASSRNLSASNGIYGSSRRTTASSQRAANEDYDVDYDPVEQIKRKEGQSFGMLLMPRERQNQVEQYDDQRNDDDNYVNEDQPDQNDPNEPEPTSQNVTEPRNNWYELWSHATFSARWQGTLASFMSDIKKRSCTLSGEMLASALLPKGRTLDEEVILKNRILGHDKQNCYQVEVRVLNITNSFDKAFDIRCLTDEELNIIYHGEKTGKYMCGVPPRNTSNVNLVNGGIIVNRAANVTGSKAIQNLAENSPIRIFYNSIIFFPDNLRNNDGREAFVGLVPNTAFTEYIFGEELDPKDREGKRKIRVFDRISNTIVAAGGKPIDKEAKRVMNRLSKEYPNLESAPRNIVLFAYGENLVIQEKVKKGFVNLAEGMTFVLLPKNRTTMEAKDGSFADINDVSEFCSSDVEDTVKQQHLNRCGFVEIELYMKCVYPHIGIEFQTDKYEKEREIFAKDSKAYYTNTMASLRRNQANEQK